MSAFAGAMFAGEERPRVTKHGLDVVFASRAILIANMQRLRANPDYVQDMFSSWNSV